MVIDELHYYRGVLGSHLANVLRRLKRVVRLLRSVAAVHLHLGDDCQSAGAGARAHWKKPFELVDRQRRARGGEILGVLQPAGGQSALGIRRGYLNETRRMAANCSIAGQQTLVFANSRLATEILVTYLKDDSARGACAAIGAAICRWSAARSSATCATATFAAVVATNALELGIDVGAWTWRCWPAIPGPSPPPGSARAARDAGRHRPAVLVASSAPLDQFMVQNPEYFFGRSPEHAYVNPDNLLILLNHLKCAAFELPLREDEKFGALDTPEAVPVPGGPAFCITPRDGWHWVSESYPADAVSLRSVSSDNFVMVDNTGDPA